MARPTTALCAGAQPTRASRIQRKPVVYDLRPRLHRQVVDPHLVEREQLTGELVRLSNRDLRRIAVDKEDDPEVHLRHRRRVLVEEAEQPGLEGAVVYDLLLPFPLQPVEDGIAGVEADGVDMC